MVASPTAQEKHCSGEALPGNHTGHYNHLYCRVGANKVKAKMCTETGKFNTVTVPSNYKEPQSKFKKIQAGVELCQARLSKA